MIQNSPYTLAYLSKQLWYYADAQHRIQGPISFDTLHQLHTNNTIQTHTLIWSKSTPDWIKFQDFFPTHMLPLLPLSLDEVLFSLSGKISQKIFLSLYCKITLCFFVILFLLIFALQHSFISSSLVFGSILLSIFCFTWIHFALCIKYLNNANSLNWFTVLAQIILSFMPIIGMYLNLILYL